MPATAGTYQVQLFWQKYDASGTAVVESGAPHTETITIVDGPNRIFTGGGNITYDDSTDEDGNFIGTGYSSDTFDIYVAVQGQLHLYTNSRLWFELADPNWNNVATADDSSVLDVVVNVQPGVYHLWCGGSSVGTYSLTADLLPYTPVPVITNTALPAATLGVAYTATVTTDIAVIARYAGGLPLGLACNSVTGVISGTPALAGDFDVFLYAANSSGHGLSKKLTLSVAKGSQSITFPSLSNRSNIDSVFTLSATASSGLDVTYLVVSGSATVTGNIVTLDGPIGTVTIRALQVGNASYNSAVPVDRSFTVSYAAPTIVTHPSAQSVAAGGTVTFAVEATGSPTLSYQWRKGSSALSNSGPASGATTAALTLTSVSVSDAGNYNVVVTNPAGSITSNNAALTVTSPPPPPPPPPGGTPPSITILEPASWAAKLGATVQLHAEATGNPAPTLQWLKNGAPITSGSHNHGETTTRFTIFDLSSSDAGNYSVRATNSQGSVTSATIPVSVGALAATLVPVISLQPSSQQVAVGTSAVSLSVTADGAGELRYQWFKEEAAIPFATDRTYSIFFPSQSHSGRYRVVVSNDFGTTISDFTTICVGPQTTAPLTRPLAIPLPLNVPARYSLLAQNYPLNNGLPTSWTALGLPTGLTLNTSTGIISGTPTVQTGVPFAGSYTAINVGGSSTSNLTINVLGATSLPWIYAQPASFDAPISTHVALAVYAAAGTGSGVLTYQWKKNGVAMPGKTSAVLEFASVQSSDEAVYTCVCGNAVGSVTSAPAFFAIRPESGPGSRPSAEFISLSVRKPNPAVIPNPIAIPLPATLDAVVDLGITVGDTITITSRAYDSDGNLSHHDLNVFPPISETPTSKPEEIGAIRPRQTGLIRWKALGRVIRLSIGSRRMTPIGRTRRIGW